MKHHHDDRSTDDLARGLVRDGGAASREVTWFSWTDPETGERLRVALGASDAFRQRLERSGFIEVRSAKPAGDPAAA